MEPAHRRFDRLASWIAACLAILLFAGWGFTQRDRVLQGKNDFLQLYTGANLIGTPELYSAAANRQFQERTVGYTLPSVLYSRPPFYAALLRPLAWLPYRAAYGVFEGLSLAGYLFFLWSFRKSTPELPLLGAFSLPVFVNLLNGQDVTLVLALATGAVLLRRKGWPVAAGLMFSLCAIKFHLLVFVPLALLRWRERRMLAGGIAGGAGLVLLSFATAGAHWPAQYLAALSNPDIHPSPGTSVTLRAVQYALTGSDSVAGTLLLSVPVVLLVLYLLWKSASFEHSLAVALLGGLLVAYHAYIQDTAILLLAFALLLPCAADKRVRAVAALALMPPLYFLTMAGSPYSAALPLWLVLWTALLV